MEGPQRTSRRSRRIIERNERAREIHAAYEAQMLSHIHRREQLTERERNEDDRRIQRRLDRMRDDDDTRESDRLFAFYRDLYRREEESTRRRLVEPGEPRMTIMSDEGYSSS